MVSNPKGHVIQNLGSTHTYLRRYLWVMALELVESDEVDAGEPKVEKQVEKPVEKKTDRIDKFPKIPKPKETGEPWQINVDMNPGTDTEDWLKSVSEASDTRS